jgi:hypothetical protein
MTRQEQQLTNDPIRTNQSKYRGRDGRLRYQADGSEVFPGPTGVRRWPDQLGTPEPNEEKT